MGSVRSHDHPIFVCLQACGLCVNIMELFIEYTVSFLIAGIAHMEELYV